MKHLPPPASAPRHPIAVVSERTGLSQDVLRVWERRYGVVHPSRGPNAQRLYSDADVERLALLHRATRGGRAIRQVATLDTGALAALVAEDEAARAPAAVPEEPSRRSEEVVDVALALGRALEATRLDELLRRSSARLGYSSFIDTVAMPLLRRIGDEWHAGRLAPSVEHVVSSTVHDIIVETMRAFGGGYGAPAALVATPAGDRHAIGAALVGAVVAMEGWRVVYLGADLPAEEIASAARAANVRVVALSVVYLDDRDRVLGELRRLRESLPASVTLVTGGAGAAALREPLTALGIRVHGSMEGLAEELRRAGLS